MMKKILIVANEAKEHIMKFHIPTIKMLKDDGWVVHVACGGRDKIPFCDCQIQLPCDRNPFRVSTFKSVYILKKIIQKENYNIVHCHTATGGLIARIAAIGAKKNGLKVFYTAHGLHFYNGSSIISWMIYFPVEYILSRITDLIITINEEDYQNTIKYLAATNNIKINGTGVALESFKNSQLINNRDVTRAALGISEDTIVLVYVAELCRNKNQEFLIHMINSLKKNIPDLCLLLIGPDHNDGKFQSIAEKLSLGNIIKFLGWRDDVPDLLAAADYAVASSISEGLGLNIIEAMASGLPVIASDNRGHRDIIDDGIDGFLVEQDNVEKMVETLVMLSKDEVLKKRIVANGYKKIKKYDQKNALQELQQIYHKY